MPLELFTQRSFVADLIRLTLDFIQKTKKSPSEPPFGDFRGNVRTSSIACWKAHSRLPIRYNWTFFAISYGWDVTSKNLLSRRFLKGVGHFELKFKTEGASSTNHCWCQKTRVIALSCSIKVSAVHLLVCHKARMWQTDRQMEGQTELRELIPC